MHCARPLRALPESERTVVLLYSMGGDSQAGIAEFWT
jgi:hypothetical protein